MKPLTLIAVLAISWSAHAQRAKLDFYPATKLPDQKKMLRESLDPRTGTAARTLEKYPNHLTMLILREKNGQSELHMKVADVIFVLDGSAELWSGGKMVGASNTAEGEQRGSGLTGTDHISLQKGDIVHIPAGQPHQVRLPTGGSFTYFVVKVAESN